jgi:D-threo-aldose 1-dehydrogenase
MNPATMDLFEPVALGSSKLKVSRIGLGLREIGLDPTRTAELLARSVELGVRYLDVAPTYGDGIAERRLGAALPALGRENVVISTKVGQLLRPPNPARRMGHALLETVTGGEAGRAAFARRAGRALRAPADRLRRPSAPSPATPASPPPTPVPGASAAAGDPAGEPAGPTLVGFCDYSYDGVMRGLEESLARLRTDRVELVFIHDPDLHHRQALRGGYRALDALRKAGTIDAVGVGMNHTEMLVRFAGEGDFDAFLIAGRYSLLDQSAADRLFPVAAERGIAIIAAGVFNGGILADPIPGAIFDYAPASEERLREAQRRREICDRHGVSIKAAALQFPMAHPAVTSVLLGATSAAELDESIDLLRTPLPPGLWTDLQAEGCIAPGVPVPA